MAPAWSALPHRGYVAQDILESSRHGSWSVTYGTTFGVTFDGA
jgi:hypothetical protein